MNETLRRAYFLCVGNAAIARRRHIMKECSIVNRISGYALALALGLSVTSTAAFAADASSQATPTQTASARNEPAQGTTSLPGPYRWQLEQGPYAQVSPYDRPSQYNAGGGGG